jgi:RNA polymerase sigma-70 factor (ECF subfamily)
MEFVELIKPVMSINLVGRSQQEGSGKLRALEKSSDSELLRLMLSGDRDAFEELYERRQGGIYRFALRMSGSEALAEDATHDVFVSLIRDGRNFDETRGSLSAYMYAMARHRILRLLAKERGFVSTTPIDQDSDEESGEERLIVHFDPINDLSKGETIMAVRQAVLALPVHYREVVVLCSFHEMNYADAAMILNCPVGTVRSRLNRARTILIEKLRSVWADEQSIESMETTRCLA